MKVFVATEGSYSDYGIVGIFTNKEDAANCSLSDDWYEEELREGPMDIRTHHVASWAASTASYLNDKVFTHSYDLEYNGLDKPEVSKGNFGINARGWDKEKVTKIVSDFRAQYLAKKEGIA